MSRTLTGLLKKNWFPLFSIGNMSRTLNDVKNFFNKNQKKFMRNLPNKLSLCETMGKLSDNLASLMAKRELNQAELAKKSGISRPLINSYLHEAKQAKFPSLKNLLALARALNCTLEQLTGLESLHGVEQKVDDVKSGKLKLSEQAEQLGRLYNGLSDDTAKELIQDMILKATERETKKKGGASDKRK